MTSHKEDQPGHPLVSFIVVALGRPDETLRCLEAITNQDYDHGEIILVDDGTGASLVDPVRRDFPETRIICLEENQGPCRARNLACHEANGRYFAFVDNDCELRADWLSRMLEAIEKTADIGGVASAVLQEGEEELVDSLGLCIADNGMCRQVGHGKPLPDAGGSRETICFHTCACLVRAEAMAEVGYFDETFFVYFEEPDLCLRMWWAGWRVILEPGAVAVHHRVNTIGVHSLRKLYYLERNHYWVVLKSMPMRQLWLLPLNTAWRYLVAAGLVMSKGLARNDCRDFCRAIPFFQLAKTIMAANLAALRHAPGMLRKRRSLKRTISNRQMQAILKRHRITTRQALVSQGIIPPWEKDH